MESLPSELIFEIIKYLNKRQICYVSQLNKKFFKLLQTHLNSIKITNNPKQLFINDKLILPQVLEISETPRNLAIIDNENNLYTNGYNIYGELLIEEKYLSFTKSMGCHGQNDRPLFINKIPNIKALHVSYSDTNIGVIDINHKVWIAGKYKEKKSFILREIPQIRAIFIHCGEDILIIDQYEKVWICGSCQKLIFDVVPAIKVFSFFIKWAVIDINYNLWTMSGPIYKPENSFIDWNNDWTIFEKFKVIDVLFIRDIMVLIDTQGQAWIQYKDQDLIKISHADIAKSIYTDTISIYIYNINMDIIYEHRIMTKCGRIKKNKTKTMFTIKFR